MNRLLIIPLLFSFLLNTAAQDSIRVVNIFKQQNIKEGKYDSRKTLAEQQTFNKDNLLVFRIIYNDSVAASIESATRYFYKDKHVISEESTNAIGDILSVKRYHYNTNAQPEFVRYYLPENGWLVNVRSTRYIWQDTILLTKDILNKNQKKICEKSFEYSENKVTEIANFKKGSDSTGLKSKIITQTFSDAGIIRKEIVSLGFDKAQTSTHIDYSYAENKLREERWYNENGDVLKYIEYSWNAADKLRFKKTFDGDGSLLTFLSYDYKNYVHSLSTDPMIDLAKPLKKVN